MIVEEIRDRPAPGCDDMVPTLLAVVIPSDARSDPGVGFLTDRTQSLQVGVMSYRAGHVVPAHAHLPNPRTVTNTQEVVVVRSGTVRVDFFGAGDAPVCSRFLHQGDVVVLLWGGHRVEVFRDADLLEVKTGPYLGRELDKRTFG